MPELTPSSDWTIWNGCGEPHDDIEQRLPKEPPWRRFEQRDRWRAASYRPGDDEIAAVNAALLLRRPLLVTGNAGNGKSTLAYAVARELNLGEVLHWPINSRTTLADGLYRYDAIARLRDANLAQVTGGKLAEADPEDIGRYLSLGPLGTALLPASRPRVLLIDEIDKSDMDFPNDLLHVFEEGTFDITELQRQAAQRASTKILPFGAVGDSQRVTIPDNGRVQCTAFPFVVITSNGERELPPPFLRRCIQLKLEDPDRKRLREIVAAHLGQLDDELLQPVLEQFIEGREQGTLATDQLLNAMYLVTSGQLPAGAARDQLLNIVFHDLGSG